MMRKILFVIVLLGMFFSVDAQRKIYTNQIEVRQKMKLNGYTIEGVSNDTLLVGRDSSQLITEYAVRNYVDNGKQIIYVSDTLGTPVLGDAVLYWDTTEVDQPIYKHDGIKYIEIGTGSGGGFIPDGVTITPTGGAVDTSLIATKSDIKYNLVDTLYYIADGQSNAIGQQASSQIAITDLHNLQFWDSTTVDWVSPVLGLSPFNVNGADNLLLRLLERKAKENPYTMYRGILSGSSGTGITYWADTPFTGITEAGNLINSSLTGNIEAVIWMQGEGDRFETRQAYKDDFEVVISKYRDFPQIDSTTKFLLSGLFTGEGCTHCFQDSTLQEIGFNQDHFTSYATSRNLLAYDGVHFTNEALFRLGSERLYNAEKNTPYLTYSNQSTGGITGTQNYISKFASPSTIENSQIFDNGTNVGIGTVSPNYKLDVPSSIVRFGKLEIGDWEANSTFGSIGLASLDQSQSGNYSMLVSPQGDLYFNGITGRDMFFNVNNSIKMVLDELGNFGIGTSNPLYKLDAPYNTRIGLYEIGKWEFDPTFGSIGLASLDQSQSGNYSILTSPVGNTYINSVLGGNMYFQKGGINEMMIDNSGNLGLGSDPDNTRNAKIQVEASIFSGWAGHFKNIGNTSNRSGLYIETSGSDAASKALQISTGGNGANSLVLDGRGYFGMGTLPLYPIHIKDAVGNYFFESSGTASFFDIQNNTNRFRFGINSDGGSSNSFQFRNVTSGELYALTISEINSNVGIGTNQPDAKLDVEGGNVRFSDYGGGTVTGTATQLLGVDVDGDVIEIGLDDNNLYGKNGTLTSNRTINMNLDTLNFSNGVLLADGYGAGTHLDGSYSYVLAPSSIDGKIGEFPLSALQNHTYNNTLDGGVSLIQSGSTVTAKITLDSLTADPSPVTSTTYTVIQTGAFSAKKILIDDLFIKGIDAYNDNLEVVVAATAQAAQTASTSTVGEEFWWRITGETGLQKMRKE